MATKYEEKVIALKDRILAALAQHSEPSETALDILEAASPSLVVRQPPAAPKISGAPSASESALLHNAILAAILDISKQSTSNEQQLMDYHVGSTPALAHLIDAVLYLAIQNPPAIDLVLPATCLETAVEAATNAECEGILTYLDSRLAEFKRPGIMPKSHHTLLRTCTLLLKRLSKSQDSSLCGRVLLFLAKFLPLTERSGVNLTGAFHVDNLTPVENVDEGAVDAEGRPLDAQFYATFWGLQKWFSNPPLALAPGRWSDISRDVRAVLDKFSKEKVTVTAAAANGDASVKYLSSARLLPLQLRDASFRRHFLLQALVLMAWVEHPLLKEWTEKGAKGRTLEDLQDLRQKVFSTLEQTPEKGKEFADAIRGVLSGESAWATWKHAGCPPEPLQMAPLAPSPETATAELGPPRKKQKPSPDAVYGVTVGSEELTRLWNLTEDNLSTLGADDRGGFKTLRQLMEPVIDEMNEEPGTTDEEMKASKNSAYSWKTLRLLARDSLPAFAAAVRAGGDLEVAARALYPDEVPPAPEPPAAVAEAPEGEEKQQPGQQGSAAEGGASEGVAEAPSKGAAAEESENRGEVGMEETTKDEKEDQDAPKDDPMSEEEGAIAGDGDGDPREEEEEQEDQDDGSDDDDNKDTRNRSHDSEDEEGAVNDSAAEYDNQDDDFNVNVPL